ncbi:protein HOTHEAD-like, partial [Dorcoceras hygrometricum]
EHPAEYRYPFIGPASSFSSQPPPSTNRGFQSGDGEFDYIIVGGGTAGCPLAATLSQKYSVLLLERGGTPFANSNVSFLQNFHITLADISSTSASQMFISTDGVFNSRARVLGGGTCINAGFYSRASSSYVKGVGWDAELVNEAFPWIENQIVHRPPFGSWQRAIRDSLVEVGISPYNGFTYDHLYGTKVGGTIFDRFGRRHTAAELLASANPENLRVLVHATVQKIEFDTTGKRPRAVGVTFKDEKGEIHQAFISKRPQSEVIISSGAIGSPQLLMLSGVGPKDELEKFNIPVVLDNELVGKGMSDNPLNTIFVPTNKPVKMSLIETVGITKLGVYIEASCGFGQSTDSIHRHHGIASAEIGQLSTIPPKQRTHEAIQAFKERKQDLPYEVFQGGFILEKIAKPLSTGHISLKNTNIEDNPSITFNYFSHPDDLARCVEGIRLMEKIFSSKRFTNYTQYDKEKMDRLLNMSVEANVNLIPKHTNNTSSLEQFCKDTVITIWHYHGGCQVGKVVSPDYKVLGVDSLRVIDGSTFYDSPGTNPQATVLMLGRTSRVRFRRPQISRNLSARHQRCCRTFHSWSSALLFKDHYSLYLYRAPGSDQFHEEIGTSTVGGFGLLIRSTTGIQIPSLVCTRKVDEDFTDGISSTERSKQDFRRRRATTAAATAAAWGGEERKEELYAEEHLPQRSIRRAHRRCRRDQSPVVTFVLHAPATTTGALPTGPPPGPGGSNVTDLASNRDLTREIWPLQVDAPAILRRRDHLLVFAFVLPAPATTDGALLAGHPQVQEVLTRPTTAPTELARRRTNAGKETHATCTNTHCSVCDIKPLVRPQFHHFEPRKATPRTTMNHLTLLGPP